MDLNTLIGRSMMFIVMVLVAAIIINASSIGDLVGKFVNLFVHFFVFVLPFHFIYKN